MNTRLWSCAALVTLVGCKDLLQRGKGSDAGASADATTTAATANAPDATPGASASAAASASATPAERPAPLFAAFSGQTSGKTTFRVAFERVGSDARAIIDTGSAIALAGKMSDASHFALRSVKVAKGEKPATLVGSLEGGSLKATFTDQGKSQSLASGGSGPVAATFDEEYTGHIGKQFVRMKLSRHTGTLTGIYRYASSASDLHLDGVVHDDGRLELTEKVGAKQTGKIVGVFASKEAILAQWQSPDGSRSAPVTLEKGSGYPETRAYDNGVTLFPQEKLIQGNHCKVDEVFPQIRGASDKAAMTEVNTYLRGESGKQKGCEGPDDPSMGDFETSEGYTLDTRKGRFIGVRRVGYSFAGGAHGSGGSVCDVVDTKTVKHFKLASRLSEAGMKKLATMVTASLAKQNGVAKLSEAGFNTDDVQVTKDTDLCLGDSFVEVEYDAYELGPYMLGAPSARFPKAQVKDLFEKDDVTDAIFETAK